MLVYCQVSTQGTGRGSIEKGKLPNRGGIIRLNFKRLRSRRVLTEIGLRGRKAVLIPTCVDRSRTVLGPLRVSNRPDESPAADRRRFPSRSVRAKDRTPTVTASRQVRSLRPVQTVIYFSLYILRPIPRVVTKMIEKKRVSVFATHDLFIHFGVFT